MAEVLHHSWNEQGFTAPFRVTAIAQMPSKSLLNQNPAAYYAEMRALPYCCRGACAVCSTGITTHYVITDAKGNKFSVGSDCVEKVGDTKLIEQARLLKNKRAREVAAAKRLALRLEREAAFKLALEAELDAERKANNGKTLAEVAAEAKKQREHELREVNKKLFDALEESNFGKSIIREFIQTGELPKNRAINICRDIYAKFHGGRANSKAFFEKASEFNSIYGTC